MSTKKIHKTIAIDAKPQKVWQVLLESPYIEDWYAEFGEGLKVETDWSPESSYRVVGTDGFGMIGKIAENVPNRVLSIEPLGIILANKEDYDSPEAAKVKGNRETYHLFETHGGTNLEIESVMVDEYYDMMAEMWDKALVKIKALSEKI